MDDKEVEMSPQTGVSHVPTPKASIRQQVVGNTLYLWNSERENELLNQCLNSGEAVVWMLCDGRRSVDEIAQEIAAAYGIPYDEARQRIVGILDEFYRLGLLSA